jgi:glycosyltransferase involved in cell wall biosynthesis
MHIRPVVSVVTPVYNGGKFLAECIESVLAQDFTEFEFVILDNASKDDTGEIASRYARADPRIRLVRNETTLPVIENWNAAVALMSPESVYYKTLHADDVLYPNCLERMVALAQANPSVGVVGSLRQRGDHLECEGLPAGREIFSGTEVARLFLKREVFGFAPTSGMIRSDLVRVRRPFYPTRYLHADLAAYFDILDETDFGFIDEVLCFSRTHADSITATVAERRQTLLREWVFMLHDYGHRYFSADELASVEAAHLRRYHRILVRHAIATRDRDFLRFHIEGLRQAGREPSLRDFTLAVGAELWASIAHPGKLFAHLRGTPARR